MDDHIYENKFKNTVREIEDIPEHAPIHIWYANNADEQIGLRYFLYLLRNKGNEIYLLNGTVSTSEQEQPIFHTGQLETETLNLLFEQQKSYKPLVVQDHIYYQKEWIRLSQTKECLRIWKNDELVGVSEDYYDPLLISCIEKLHNEQANRDFIKVGEVIGEMVAESTCPLNVFFLEYRIRHLVYTGILELKGIPKSMRHYSVMLR